MMRADRFFGTHRVSPEGAGSRVRVSWDLNPKQFLNRNLFVHLRLPQLKKDIPESLAALEKQLARERSAA